MRITLKECIQIVVLSAVVSLLINQASFMAIKDQGTLNLTESTIEPMSHKELMNYYDAKYEGKEFKITIQTEKFK